MERIQMLKERTRAAQKQRCGQMLEKQDEREAQLVCMSRITALEQKEMEARKLNLENPLTEEEKAILADYRKEYDISDYEDLDVGEEKSDTDEEKSDEEEEEEVGAELTELCKDKFKPLPIRNEQIQEGGTRPCEQFVIEDKQPAPIRNEQVRGDRGTTPWDTEARQ
jgi:hypothetical protein